MYLEGVFSLRQKLNFIYGAQFVVSLSTAASSHRKTASAGTSDGSRTQNHDRSSLHVAQLVSGSITLTKNGKSQLRGQYRLFMYSLLRLVFISRIFFFFYYCAQCARVCCCLWYIVSLTACRAIYWGVHYNTRNVADSYGWHVVCGVQPGISGETQALP